MEDSERLFRLSERSTSRFFDTGSGGKGDEDEAAAPASNSGGGGVDGSDGSEDDWRSSNSTYLRFRSKGISLLCEFDFLRTSNLSSLLFAQRNSSRNARILTEETDFSQKRLISHRSA